MDDLKMLYRAKTYIEKLANGIDPVTGAAAADDDLINNVRISRCLFYVADILRQVIENDGVVGRPQKAPAVKKQQFAISFELLSHYSASDKPIPVSEFTRRVNDLIPPEIPMVKLKYQSVTQFLIEAGLLTEGVDTDGKRKKYPTPAGESLGIATEHRVSAGGPYTVVVYERSAQQFLLDNMDAIVAVQNRPRSAQE